MGDKSILITELIDILRHAHANMNANDYFLDHSLDLAWGTMPIPAFTL